MKHILWGIVLVGWSVLAGSVTPGTLATAGRLAPDQGTVTLEFQPGIDVKTGELRIVNFVLADNRDGRVDLGLTCGNGLSYLRFYLGDTATDKLNIGIYRPAELPPHQWNRLRFGWTPERVFIEVNGELLGSFVKRFPLHWGENVTIGDAALPGTIRNLEFSPACDITQTGDFLQLTPDHSDMVYAVGAPAQIAVTALRNNRMPDAGSVTLRYCRDDGTEFDQEVLQLSHGTTGKPVTLNTPGFLRVQAAWEETGLQQEILVAFAPDQIIGARPEPEDFDEFWQSAFAAASTLPPEAELSPAPEFDTATQECFRVRFPRPDGSGIYGFLGVPRDRTRQYPGLIIIPGAGPGVATPTEYFQEDVLNVLLNVHAYDATREAAALPERYREAYGDTDYCFLGLEGAREYFYFRVNTGFHRAVAWLKQHPAWDGKNLGATGSSQGGGLTLFLAGLHPEITHVVANVPALADHGAEAAGRRPGWPNFSGHTGKPAPAWTGYYDAVNFARRIQAHSVTVIVGFLDPVCPPTSVYAAFNAIPAADKQMICEPDMRHEWPPAYGQAIRRMVKQMNASQKRMQ